MSKVLKISHVNKRYKVTKQESFQALYDINLEFEKGELVSIVGESGSGKSTLMNLIGGLDSDFTGKILVGKDELNKLSEKELDNYRKNKVGFVFQSFNLISHLSILDNVTLALTLSNVSEKEKVDRATELLKKVGLENQLKKHPNQLSGGQKQRVAIARALINDPEIIIADEPTGALDSGTTAQILQILKEIADSGKLVIMVTHSEKVAAISSRVVELSDGKIVSDKLNENYQKEQGIIKKDKVEKKEKQNLSLFSAIRLSVHNMWASKVKNFLMAFGVAIGIGSLILMLCFSSGITDFIHDTMNSYSNPNIVTISRRNKSFTDMFNYSPFTEEEETTVVEEINTHLQSKKIDFVVDKNKNLSHGFMAYAIGGKLEATISDITDSEKKKSIFCLYSVPPYYTNTNVMPGGTLSTYEKKGFMFTREVLELFPNEDVVGKEVTITITINGTEKRYFSDKICGIMDTPSIGGSLIAYIDYNYLKDMIDSVEPTLFGPTSLYIDTSAAKNPSAVTDEINTYLAASDKYTGSIEEQLVGMFDSMSSTIGTSLVVISSISLFVSAMMILVVLYMSVSERTKEIGVLKSIGARRKDIKRIFTAESFLIGVLSGLCGIIFNLILTLIVWLVLTNTIGIAPISYRWWYFFLALGVSVIISMLSGLYPASKAAKLDPVESLRRE